MTPNQTHPLHGQVALVAGATRGCGRGIAVELGAAGATVYCTGRTTRTQQSPMNRPETIEETAELVDAAGGSGIAVQVDHTEPAQVESLMARIQRDQGGRLDILVNDVWGGDDLTAWGRRFWELSLENGLLMLRQAIHSHIITSRYALPLMLERGAGLIVEVTDGNNLNYRGHFYYDLVKTSVMRLALALDQELRKDSQPTRITALAVTPGYLRSEAMLDGFGVTELIWRDAIEQDVDFAVSETPRFLGRVVAALAADPDVARYAGQALASWDMAKVYEIDDVDGRRPDWGSYTPVN
ncbi:MAG: SDR family oxidoreductase [Chloroflexota bacterium]|nr:SDR family oxidoreductase [Chloroflexota bacterium]MDE2896906.1 SDR family oxidoreductase [Chloroflexota bacterium]